MPVESKIKVKQKTIALAGNPNTGKTTLFNALTGLNQRVGNYPGVTVERKSGIFYLYHEKYELIDLPGSYSLAARSPDEMVAVDVLLGLLDDTARPDCVVIIVDASNLDRNLFLVSQILELGIPVVIALNMVDVAAARGIKINQALLSIELGIPVIPMVASKRQGLAELQAAIGQVIHHKVNFKGPEFPQVFNEARARLREYFNDIAPLMDREVTDIEIKRLILDRDGYAETRLRVMSGNMFDTRLSEARAKLTTAGYDLWSLEAEVRYEWIGNICSRVVGRRPERIITLSDRIDRVLTHRLWGTLIFIGIMVVIFQSIFTWALPFMEFINYLFGQAGSWVESHLPAGMLSSLLVDGVIAGVGGIVVFLPQILILFFFIAVLEDSGYMSRAAFLMDRLLRWCGLSGKSFIPMLSSLACAVPGIMSARTIENRRDRLATIMVAPLMTCSARLPVYAVLIAAFIPGTTAVLFLSWQGVTLTLLYLLGIITAVIMAFIFKRTLLRGETPPFIMELPSYKVPSFRTVFIRMFERGGDFLRRAGTIILALAIIVWALGYFPRNKDIINKYESEQARVEASGLIEANLESEILRLEGLMNKELLEQSYLGRMGRVVEPVFAPLGWDWRISMATIASFPAREVIVATLGTIFGLSAGADGGDQDLRAAITEARRSDERPLFTPLVAVSIMVFFALCCQCGATVATIKRESNSWKWAGWVFLYMTCLAYLGALLVYQGGRLLGWS